MDLVGTCHSVKGRWFQFNPTRFHAVTETQGTRYSIALYIPAGVSEKLSPEHWDELLKLGFPVRGLLQRSERVSEGLALPSAAADSGRADNQEAIEDSRENEVDQNEHVDLSSAVIRDKFHCFCHMPSDPSCASCKLAKSTRRPARQRLKTPDEPALDSFGQR
eukprot:938422-Amphidinium_carterae.1